MTSRFQSLKAWLSLASAILVGCGRAGPASEHAVMAAGFEPLRTELQADSGKVRAILLASPT